MKIAGRTTDQNGKDGIGMGGGIRYVHTNLIARNWKALARFYADVFGCTYLPPERHLSGKWIEQMTGIPGVRVNGVHMRLPGYDKDGPTLEIFSYEPQTGETAREINRPGFVHLAFHVEDVRGIIDCLIRHGGALLGEIIEKDYETLGRLTAAYARDPEGNILEIQRWQK